jgi:hypothetical protein
MEIECGDLDWSYPTLQPVVGSCNQATELSEATIC